MLQLQRCTTVRLVQLCKPALSWPLWVLTAAMAPAAAPPLQCAYQLLFFRAANWLVWLQVLSHKRLIKWAAGVLLLALSCDQAQVVCGATAASKRDQKGALSQQTHSVTRLAIQKAATNLCSIHVDIIDNGHIGCVE